MDHVKVCWFDRGDSLVSILQQQPFGVEIKDLSLRGFYGSALEDLDKPTILKEMHFLYKPNLIYTFIYMYVYICIYDPYLPFITNSNA